MGKNYQDMPYTTITDRQEELRFKVAGIVFVIALLAFGGIMYLFYKVLAKFEPASIHLWAAFLTTAMIFGTPLVAFIGYYFGKVEARGFLEGADRIMDRVFGKLVDTVNVRDQSRVNIKNEAPTVPNSAPMYYLPNDPNGYNFPPITERSESSRGDTLIIE